LTADDGFRLSRIQAEGWNAARRIPPSRLTDIAEKEISVLNPYAIDPERSRWRAGFNSARESESF